MRLFLENPALVAQKFKCILAIAQLAAIIGTYEIPTHHISSSQTKLWFTFLVGHDQFVIL